MTDLFDNQPPPRVNEPLEEGAVLLRGFVADPVALLADVDRIAAAAPFRHLVTPGGYTMSVAMTNCGRVGWMSNRSGYRYDPIDPDTGQPWPAMPASFLELARTAAAEAGFVNYDPDACLINRYVPGAKLGLHVDRDEDDPLHRSFPFRWGCPLRSFGAASAAPIRFAGCALKTATSPCGADPRASSTMEFRRSRTDTTRSPAVCAST
jgi:DNA alkylation damage repair protein AlkB